MAAEPKRRRLDAPAAVVAAGSCGICDTAAGKKAPILWRDPSGLFVVTHKRKPCGMVGHLQLNSTRCFQGPASMTDAEAAALGVALQRCERALEQATGCDRVYTAALGSPKNPHFHCHLLPLYLGADPASTAEKGVAGTTLPPHPGPAPVTNTPFDLFLQENLVVEGKLSTADDSAVAAMSERWAAIMRGGSLENANVAGNEAPTVPAAASGCGICDTVAGKKAPILWRDPSGLFVVTHKRKPCGMVGHLQLNSTRCFQGPASMTDAEAAALGVALQRCERALEQASGCDRVYTAALGSPKNPHFHCHLLPLYVGADPASTAEKGVVGTTLPPHPGPAPVTNTPFDLFLQENLVVEGKLSTADDSAVAAMSERWAALMREGDL